MRLSVAIRSLLLLLILFTAFGWARSYFCSDYIRFSRETRDRGNETWIHRSLNVYWTRGSIAFNCERFDISGPAAAHRNSYPESTRCSFAIGKPRREFLPETLPRMFGFGYESSRTTLRFWIPHWLFVLLLFTAWRLTRRSPPGKTPFP